MITTDFEDRYTENQDLNREILRWINQRILSLVRMYKELGDDTGWDYEYLGLCFPRTFMEDNGIEKSYRFCYALRLKFHFVEVRKYQD